jgi:hypothetical protein
MGAGLEEEVGDEPVQPTAATAMQQSKARRNRFIVFSPSYLWCIFIQFLQKNEYATANWPCQVHI